MSLVTAAAISGVTAHCKVFIVSPLSRFVEEIFTKLANGQSRDGLERSFVPGVLNQARDLIGFGGDERLIDNLAQREICQRVLGGHALALRTRRYSSQLITGLFLVCLRKYFAETTKRKSLNHTHRP